MQQTGTSTSRKSVIPFFKPTLGKNDIKSMLETLIADGLDSGEAVLSFEKEFAGLLDMQKAISVQSHFAAYQLAFAALSIGPGDEVLLAATAPRFAIDALMHQGARPVLLDAGREQIAPDWESVRPQINDNTRAIVLSYSYGAADDFQGIYAGITEGSRRKLRVIEDISAIVGAERDGMPVGHEADLVVCALQDDALLTIGRGAVLATDSRNLAAAIKDLRHPGGRADRARFDYLISDYQASLGLEQLSNLGTFLDRRRRIAQVYLDAVANSVFQHRYNHPGTDSYSPFLIFSDQEAETVRRHFTSYGVETRPVFPYGNPMEVLDVDPGRYPNTLRMIQRGVLLPVYPNLTRAQVEKVVAAIRSFH